MDLFSPPQRSEIMSKIRSKNTKPEMIVRGWLHRHGFRFRLHRKDLSGKPDIVLPKYRTVIFVNGCFWHQHPGCRRAVLPKSNQDFWMPKLQGNVERFARNVAELEKAGWTVVVIWECETKPEHVLAQKLEKLLEGRSP